MEWINLNWVKLIVTIIVIVLTPVSRHLTGKIVKNYAHLHDYTSGRTKMMIKTFNVVIVLILITLLISIWGVDTRNLLLTLSSIFAVIGVALFAQWSILSNLTASVIIFFTLKLKIGDKIKIHDKDFPIEATVKDIKSFYIYLVTEDGEQIAYPNNLILQKGITICEQE